MELNIKILLNDSCKIIVQDNSEYLSEDFTGIVKGKFKQSEVISIDILQRNKTTETINLNPVYGASVGSVQIPVTFDGWFTVVHIILPSKDWFETELNKSTGSALGLYDIVYYSDGYTIYKYIDSTITEVTIDEILEINPDATTISITSKDYVSICNLRKCYINLCQQIFNDRAFSSCWSDNDVDGELTFKRDLVWMAINVIRYLTKCNQLAEVARILEIIEGCNGLCTSTDATSKTSGCGCNS